MKNKFEIISSVAHFLIGAFLFCAPVFFFIEIFAFNTISIRSLYFLFASLFFYLMKLLFNELSNLIKRIEKIEKQLNINDKKDGE